MSPQRKRITAITVAIAMGLTAPDVAVYIVDELHQIFFRNIRNVDGNPTRRLLAPNRIVVKESVQHRAGIRNRDEFEILRLGYAVIRNLRVGAELDAVFVIQNFENLLFCHINLLYNKYRNLDKIRK